MTDLIMFDSIIKKGIERIFIEDAKSQKQFISVICKDVRDMSTDIIFKSDAFYVPNDDYMVYMFGETIKGARFGCYAYDDTCIWTNCLVFPVTDLAGRIVGFAGFNPHRYLMSKETGDKSLNYYSYSSKEVFVKGNYLFCLKGVYKKALENGYIVITDGLFDSLSLAQNGYLSGALLGSYLSDQLLAQLRFIDKVILAHDNDEAGIKLANFLMKHLSNVICMKQRYTKDVDDILKTDYKNNYLEMLNNLISEKRSPLKMQLF